MPVVATTVPGALRYFGGKAMLADWLLSHFPAHDTYVEPFGGGASVLLRKPPAHYDVYNDLDGAVVNFFRVLRDRPDDFIRAVALTPYAREEAVEACLPESNDTDGPHDALEQARRFYVRSWQTMHGAPTRGKLGWRYEKTFGRNWGTTVISQFGRVEHLLTIAARLKAVQLEHDTALRIIPRFDSLRTLFYVDPPYPQSTRTARWKVSGYAHELADDDHIALAACLRAVKGMVLLSGYDCPLYRDLYDAHGWSRVEHQSRVQSAALRTEVLWGSPNCYQRAQQMGLTLPEGAAGDAPTRQARPPGGRLRGRGALT